MQPNLNRSDLRRSVEGTRPVQMTANVAVYIEYGGIETASVDGHRRTIRSSRQQSIRLQFGQELDDSFHVLVGVVSNDPRAGVVFDQVAFGQFREVDVMQFGLESLRRR